MPTYAAFLRAINLGSTRQFPKASIKSATEAAGATEVETYINTGNVRLTMGLRSRATVESALEKAYFADRGFEVPTIVFTLADLKQIARDAQEIADGLDPEMPDDRRHYVSLLKSEPTPGAAALIEGKSTPEALAVVRGRAVHVVLATAHQATQLDPQVEKALGVATTRNLTVVRALAERWG